MDVPLYIAQATLLVVVYRWPADLLVRSIILSSQAPYCDESIMLRLSANADNVEMVLVVAIQGTEAPMK